MLALSEIVRDFLQETNQLPERFYSGPGPEEPIRQYPYALDMTMVHVGEERVSVAKCFSNQSVSRVRYHENAGDWHRHAYVELGYVFKGAYRIETEEGILEFPEKEFCLIDPQLKHRDVFENASYVVLFLCMSEDFFDSVFLRQLESREDRNLAGFINNALYNPSKRRGYLRLKTDRNLDEVEAILSRMIQEISVRESGYDFLLKGYALRLISTLSAEVYQSLSSEEKLLYKRRLYDQVEEYMKAHADSVTIEELSRVFHFQKDYFSRLIRQMSGKSFTEKLKEIRLEKACMLLRTTDLPVNDIAVIAGYQNESYFYRIFTEKYQMTPSTWRKQNQ